ncbi:MAG TPA: serine--tRNA ligase [Ignavibacteria bacterium]|nr:serine--tRNA ligase [Bacteroidota bacterium]HRI84960.1 serine--tRNA ligase [Ignavibacteria bacterium]HRJ99655.1 serine--tRNA ligase [Ignavibacteria bacterium]
MLDIKIIREDPENVKKKLSLRNENPETIEKLYELDKSRLQLIHTTETLKENRNKVSDEIAVMKKNRENTDEKISEMKLVSEKIKTLDEELRRLDKETDDLLRYIPNLPDDSVPHGKSEKDNVQVRISGDKKIFDFKVKDHLQLGKDLDILDFERGAKISGSGFALYKGKGAKLERALINFMLDEQGKNGYREVMTPVIVKRESMEAAEKVPKFEEDMYYMEKDDMFAIPTAEVSILNIHRDEILVNEELPIKYCGFTNCFRREAGSYGKDTKGFLRVHQFNKVELITFCKPEESYAEMEKMLSHACGIIDKLGLHYRVIELCTADIGFAASKCYDIEVWSYAENKWLEASSVSNCTDYQSRRAMIRYKKPLENNKSKTELVHILNGSGLATSRLMVALLESCQTKDGNIILPEVLRGYAGFDSI